MSYLTGGGGSDVVIIVLSNKCLSDLSLSSEQPDGTKLISSGVAGSINTLLALSTIKYFHPGNISQIFLPSTFHFKRTAVTLTGQGWGWDLSSQQVICQKGGRGEGERRAGGKYYCGVWCEVGGRARLENINWNVHNLNKYQRPTELSCCPGCNIFTKYNS